jgi:hypothetical protein
MRAVLNRTHHESKQTRGRLEVFNADGKLIFSCFTLELPWKDNKRTVSCIPLGNYNVIPRTSAKYSNHLHVSNVPNRDLILIHHGNYHTDILGCILVGSAFSDINKDGFLDVTNSKVTMSRLMAAAPNGFALTITNNAVNKN